MSGPAHLKADGWKTITKNSVIQGGKLLADALGAYEKAAPDTQAACLEAVVKNATTIKGRLPNHDGNKLIIKYLSDILEEAKKAGGDEPPGGSSGNVTPNVAAGGAANAPSAGGQPGPDGQAAQYRQLLMAALSRKPLNPVSFAAYLAAKGGAVMIGNVTGAGSVLPVLAGVSGGARVAGDYVFEGGVHTFIVDAVSGGLASRLSKALRLQTGASYKVRVRDRGSRNVLDSDADPDPDEEAPVTPVSRPVTPDPAAQARPPEPARQDDAAQQRLRQLETQARGMLDDMPAGDEKTKLARAVELATAKADETMWGRLITLLQPHADTAQQQRNHLAAEAQREQDRLAAEAQQERDRLAAEAQREQDRLAAEAQQERDRVAAEAQQLEDLKGQAQGLLDELLPGDRKTRLARAVELAKAEPKKETWDKVIAVLRPLAVEARQQRQAAGAQRQEPSAARTPQVGPTTDPAALAGTLTRALGADERDILGALPRGFADGIVQVLQTAKNDLTAATTIGGPGLRKARQADILLRGALRSNPIFKAPVDPDTVAGLSDTQKAARRELAQRRRNAAVVALRSFNEHPALAATALDIIRDAEHPETVANAIAGVGALQNGRFAGASPNDGRAALMATNALKLAGTVGGNDFAARLTAYYQSDAPAQPDDLRDADQQKTTLNYTKALGGSLLGANGSLALDSADYRKVRDRLHFHPGSLRNPMLNLARHVETFSAQMAEGNNRGRCEAALRGITGAPTDKMASRLVRKTVGLADAAPLDARITRQAVLSAALTPLTQGSVGSCFATCNCMDYQESRPADLFEDLAAIARTGKLTKGGDPAPVVRKIAENENGLLRGWEYTVATLGARTHASSRKAILAQAAGNALRAIGATSQYQGMSAGGQAIYAAADTARQDEENAYDEYRNHHASTGGIDSPELTRKENFWRAKETAATVAQQRADEHRQQMTNVIRKALTYEFDSTLAMGMGTSADNSSDRGGWVLRSGATGKKIKDYDDLSATLKQAFMQEFGNGAQEANIDAVVGSEALVNAVLTGYTAQDGSFVESEGGSHEESKTILTGREVEFTNLTATRANNETPGDQARKLLVGLVDRMKAAEGETVTLSIEGVHAERGLVKHPSLDALKAGGDVAAKVNEVFAQAEQRATRALKPEEAELLVEKAAGTVFMDLFNGVVPTLPGTLTAGNLTPAQLKTRMVASITPEHLQNGKYVNPDSTMRILSEQLDSLFIGELFPKFVIADTNWGDATGKHFHVIAPDLATGKPKLYQMSDATGELSEAGASFEKEKWGASSLKP